MLGTAIDGGEKTTDATGIDIGICIDIGIIGIGIPMAGIWNVPNGVWKLNCDDAWLNEDC